jgi:hypothetical protein
MHAGGIDEHHAPQVLRVGGREHSRGCLSLQGREAKHSTTISIEQPMHSGVTKTADAVEEEDRMHRGIDRKPIQVRLRL